MSESAPRPDDAHYLGAQDALTDAFEAARKVDYAPGSSQMARLAQAEANCEEHPNPSSESPTEAAAER